MRNDSNPTGTNFTFSDLQAYQRISTMMTMFHRKQQTALLIYYANVMMQSLLKLK